MNPALAERSGYSLSTKVAMLVTLVAVLCNSQLCLEKVVTTSDQSGITMSACAVNAQIGIADWLAKGPYREWRLQRYKCVLGKYVRRTKPEKPQAASRWRGSLPGISNSFASTFVT
jgi:hypothetical protein